TEELMNYVKSLNRSNTPMSVCIVYFPEPKKGLEYDDSFYSLQVSIILPNWPARFQNADFQRFIIEVIEENVPAHITINYCWLNLQQMYLFEQAYQKWLDLRQTTIPPQPDLDQQSYELIQLLEAYATT
ncbi:MAG: hypothetical protein ACPGXL_07855, partial [Chitinophagales bacterium]